MKNKAIRGAIGAIALACFLFVGESVFAGDGDYDFDFDVDADDFAYWGSCMTVPDSGDVDQFSPCAAFDFDNDNDVDNYDFGAFQAAFQKAVPPCKPINQNGKTRAYVRAGKDGHNILGVTALIGSKSTTLCPDQTKTALSAAWVSMHHQVPTEDPKVFKPGVWAQMGHLHYRAATQPPESPATLWYVYAETAWGDTTNERELSFGPGAGAPPAQPWQTYKVERTTTADEFVTYFLGTAEFHRYEGDKWGNKTGRIAHMYAAEIMNWDDQMVGTEASRCLFSGCKYKKNLHEWPDADFEEGDLKSSNENYWGKNLLTVKAFEVWDEGAP